MNFGLQVKARGAERPGNRKASVRKIEFGAATLPGGTRITWGKGCIRHQREGKIANQGAHILDQAGRNM